MKTLLAILIFATAALAQSSFVRVFKSGTDAIDIDKSSIRRTSEVVSFNIRVVHGKTWHIRQMDLDCLTRGTRVWTVYGTPGYWRADVQAPPVIVALACH